MQKSNQQLVAKIKRLNQIGIALSAERNHQRLLHLILASARELTEADAGTLYLINQERTALDFALVQNASLGIDINCQAETDSTAPTFPSVPLWLSTGAENTHMVSAQAALSGKTVRIDDAYSNTDYDFSGTRAFDQRTGYRSQSFLTVPLRNHENDIIGVLQLLNKTTREGVGVFTDSDQELAESLASQGAVALTNQGLVTELHTLFNSFTQVIAAAIDAKSPSTGAHCRRVPDATMMLAKAASGANFPGLEGFILTPEDEYELSVASWLHDCGKIITPHHVMEKPTKLETVRDGINDVCQRLSLVAKEQHIAQLQGTITANELANTLAQLQAAEAFLRKINIGGEYLSDEDVARVEQLAAMQWQDLHGQWQPLLTAAEVENLSIRRGTLNASERKIMEDHMVHTVTMLEQLPFPKHLQRVPEYACGHHEKMDGTGYPKGLRKEQMSIPARMMGVADVFEALTAHERPYKKPMPLSQALSIMNNMAANNHLDSDIFALFVVKKVYLRYAEKHLQAEQIDTVDISSLSVVAQYS